MDYDDARKAAVRVLHDLELTMGLEVGAVEHDERAIDSVATTLMAMEPALTHGGTCDCDCEPCQKCESGLE